RAQQKNLRGRGGRLMDVFGSFTLLLAFACAVYAFVGGIGAIITRHPLLVKSTRQAGIATCVLIFIATFSLEYLLSATTFRKLTWFRTAIATSPLSTSSPRCGPVRKVRCCSGASCLRCTSFRCL